LGSQSLVLSLFYLNTKEDNSLVGHMGYFLCTLQQKRNINEGQISCVLKKVESITVSSHLLDNLILCNKESLV